MGEILIFTQSSYSSNCNLVQEIKVETNEDQNFQDFEESLCGIEFIQERRALGFKVLLQTFDKMIEMRKRWTYGFSKEISMVSIGARLMTSISLFKIKQKRKEIFENMVPVSKTVYNRLCKLLKHDNYCGFCYKKESAKGKTEAPCDKGTTPSDSEEDLTIF
ncbi:hypothetical protein SLE2022_379670 [Rubroshorea leprosula]